MPPETTKRRQKVFSEEELKDIEQKRIRGELSCAECRRLKLRCDKKVPCSSCCRRGCESICPCGILSAGQGTRFILADTDHLHRKITEMSQRIRSLEDALAILQATVSEERHPLLEDELLTVKFGAEASNIDRRPAETQAIDALGTLTLTDEGDMRYFGRSAGSEAGEEWDDISDDSSDHSTKLSTSPQLEKATKGFPFSQTHTLVADIVSRLPTRNRAHVLCQLYIDHASLFFRPIKSDELFDLFLPDIYNDPHSALPHTLAALFFVFALGALFDLCLGPYNKEAELYYHLGLTALSLKHILLETPQINTIRAVGLMATYHSMASKKYSRDSAWCNMGLAAKLALSIGLHRDSARWHMDPSTVQMRRNLWWEIVSSDVSHAKQSLALGRPPSVHLSFVDCEFPTDEEATLSQSGDIEFGFWRMKHVFARDIFSAVVDATLTAQAPSYATILDLDKKVRQITFPASFNPYVKLEDGREEYYSSAKSLKDFYASQHRTVTMLYLHRSYFAQAILDFPSNPLLSPFAPSFLTAYRSASVVIKAAAHQFDRSADVVTGVWFLLYHVFSSAVVVGSVVTRSPKTTIARSALEDLELAIRLFETSAAKSQRARVALSILRKLKDKAVVSYTQSRSTSPSENDVSIDQPDRSSTQPPHSESEDELAIFGGQTKVLMKRHRSKNSLQITGSPASTSESTPSP
ncbi:fungal-specific transcription factor domain-containing protein, partial [Desarmillaria ectypa]